MQEELGIVDNDGQRAPVRAFQSTLPHPQAPFSMQQRMPNQRSSFPAGAASLSEGALSIHQNPQTLFGMQQRMHMQRNTPPVGAASRSEGALGIVQRRQRLPDPPLGPKLVGDTSMPPGAADALGQAGPDA